MGHYIRGGVTISNYRSQGGINTAKKNKAETHKKRKEIKRRKTKK